MVAYYGAPSDLSMRADVAILNGEVVGVIGVAREREYGRFFSDISPKLRPHLRSITILRAIKAAMRFVEGYGGPVLAEAEHDEGRRILGRLGFEHVDGEFYIWQNSIRATR